MLIVLAVILLTESCDDVSKSTEALIDVLRLLEAALVVIHATLVEALAIRQINEVQAALACRACCRVPAANVQRED